MMLVHLISILVFLFALILAAPSSSNLHSSLKLLSRSRHEIQCFVSSPIRRLCRIVPSDCTRAVQILRVGDRVQAPMEFSRVTGYQVPFKVEFGSCRILVDIIAPDNPSEITTLYEISTRALEVTSRCVITPNFGRIGGRTTAGPNNLINVGVMGVEGNDEPLRPPRLSPMAIVNQCLGRR